MFSVIVNNQVLASGLAYWQAEDWINTNLEGNDLLDAQIKDTTQWVYQCEGCEHGECDHNCLAGREAAELIEARDWIADALSCYDDHVLTDTEVMLAIGFHYEGGTRQFKIDSIPTYPHERTTT